MSQFAINIIFVGGSFLLYIAIAIWAKAGSTSDFYVAGGGVHRIAHIGHGLGSLGRVPARIGSVARHGRRYSRV